jgi:hypothetical protein
MPQIKLRTQVDVDSKNDLLVGVQDKTFEYLKITITPKARVSAYFDKDAPSVEASYAELFVEGAKSSRWLVTSVIPGSRKRSGVTLPGPMFEGEQLTIEVTRQDR